MTDHLRAHDAALERLKGLHPKKIDLSLGRMRRLCAALGDPQDRLPPVVHVAGTNGKGSTTALLRAIAEAAGLRVHVLTSPHLVRFAERIRLAGRLISDDALTELLDRVEAANAGHPITFFEITNAAALLAFSETPADLAIIEVGLGGRFDATNVIPSPRVAAIAPVDLDHKEFLGEDIATIAREKAGVIKPGCIVVAGRQTAEAADVLADEAARQGVELRAMGTDYDVHLEGDRLIWQGLDRLYDLPRPALAGDHQIENAGLAIAAALALADPRLDETALAEGMRRVVWPARLQRLTAGPLAARAAARGSDLWLDGGHNPHAARSLAQGAAALCARDGRPLTVIAGLLANKDAAGVLAPFAELNPRLICTGFDAEAAADPSRLAATARNLGLSAESASNVAEALNLALDGDGLAPHILIFGSLYLAGEVLSLSRDTWPD